MKNQALFSSKDRSKKLKCRPLQFLFGAVGVEAMTLWCYIQTSMIKRWLVCCFEINGPFRQYFRLYRAVYILRQRHRSCDI